MILIAVSLSDCELFLSPHTHTHTHNAYVNFCPLHTHPPHIHTPHPYPHAQLGEIPSQIKDVSEAHHHMTTTQCITWPLVHATQCITWPLVHATQCITWPLVHATQRMIFRLVPELFPGGTTEEFKFIVPLKLQHVSNGSCLPTLPLSIPI